MEAFSTGGQQTKTRNRQKKNCEPHVIFRTVEYLGPVLHLPVKKSIDLSNFMTDALSTTTVHTAILTTKNVYVEGTCRLSIGFP